MKEIKQGFMIFILFSILTGLVYPIFITAIAQIVWKENANGSLVKVNERVIGSKLIGQKFISSKYFHGRPSTVDYKGSISGASNLGPTSKKLFEAVGQEIKKVRTENNLSTNAKIPADLALSSGSGLDPHISLESAYLQVSRIAQVRNIPLGEVKKLISQNTEKSRFKFLGQTTINVLVLNLELDKLKK